MNHTATSVTIRSAAAFLLPIVISSALAQEQNEVGKSAPAPALTTAQRESCRELGLDAAQVAELHAKPLYEFTEAEVDIYLRWLCRSEPDLRMRITHLARKNLGQPYEIYLLGEMPFEHYDPQPLYCLSKSDCLVFAEHTYAMALAHDWSSFMRLLQRIRYREGRIGVATRNHYTEADWNPSNAWLVGDITSELAGAHGVDFHQRIDRASFLKKRYGLEVDVAVEDHRDVYLPFTELAAARSQLENGDFVNIVRGVPGQSSDGEPASETFGGSAWVGHVGLIVRGTDGRLNLIHSARPSVREESLDEYIAAATRDLAARDTARKPRLLGFKFLRLQQHPMENLRALDGASAPRVSLPGDPR